MRVFRDVQGEISRQSIKSTFFSYTPMKHESRGGCRWGDCGGICEEGYTSTRREGPVYRALDTKFNGYCYETVYGSVSKLEIVLDPCL